MKLTANNVKNIFMQGIKYHDSYTESVISIAQLVNKESTNKRNTVLLL